MSEQGQTKARQGRGAVGFARTMVPLDGSAFAEAALKALDQLHQPQAETILLRAIPTMAEIAVSAGGAPMPAAVDFTPVIEAARREATEYLRDVTTRLTDTGVRCRGVVVEGDAASSILRVAAESDVEVIVMTTHGRGGLERVVFGSVADAVLRGATCPVFLIPMRDERSRAARSAAKA